MAWLLSNRIEAAHKINVVKISPQTTITEPQEKPSNKRNGNEENYIQKPDQERFLQMSIKFSSWGLTG